MQGYFRYDFDKDGSITKDDVGLLLSHAPIEKPNKDKNAVKEGQFTQSGGGGEEYIDRAESQRELQNLVNVCFKDKAKLNFEEYKHVTECVTSEMFFCIFSLVKIHFPSLAQFKRYEQGLKKGTDPLLLSPTQGRKMAQPKILSKFSPLTHMVKFSTPQVQFQAIRVQKPEDTATTEETKETAQKPYISKISAKHTPIVGSPSLKAPLSPITQAVRLPNTKIDAKNLLKSPSLFLAGKNSDAILFCECGKEISDFDKLLCSDCCSKLNQPKCEGYLSKLTNKTLTKYWMCIEKMELYCYETKESQVHLSMHTLLGCLINELEPELIGEITMFPFSIIYTQQKTGTYYSESREEQQKWVNKIKKVIGYANLLDFYELREALGKGKFGTVRLGIHKKTGKKVAIKVMKKSSMKALDVELVKQEIEILKVCQHPNLLRMLDVFENMEHIYIVTELLEGGDLFTFLEKRRFRLPEPRTAKIIHSLAAGLYYLHSYGIVHRDIKPENILMVDKTEDSDVKIVDFGLSKMIGPSQLCTEPYGTLAYVSPEVLFQQPYGKSVDVWGLGVLAYLMLVGSLPFDDEDDREVAQYLHSIKFV